MSTYIRIYDDLAVTVVNSGSPILDTIANNTHEGEVNTFAELPAAADNIGDVWVVRQTTGSLNPFTTTKFAGYYFWSGTEWVQSGIGVDTIQTLINNHAALTNNPHAVTKAQVGLANVENTSDLDKPISTATQAALDAIDVETWEYFAANWDTPPTLNKAIAGGDVYNYTLNSVTRFRFVPSTYDATQDCFYTTFDSGTDTLSGSIICRGL